MLRISMTFAAVLVIAAAFGACKSSGPGAPCSSSSECSDGTCSPGGEQCGGALTIECNVDSDCQPLPEAGAGDGGDASVSPPPTASPPVTRAPGALCLRTCGSSYCRPGCAQSGCGPNATCDGRECKARSCTADTDCKGFCVNGKCADLAGKCLGGESPP